MYVHIPVYICLHVERYRRTNVQAAKVRGKAGVNILYALY